jgi:hypothetical protein
METVGDKKNLLSYVSEKLELLDIKDEIKKDIINTNNKIIENHLGKFYPKWIEENIWEINQMMLKNYSKLNIEIATRIINFQSDYLFYYHYEKVYPKLINNIDNKEKYFEIFLQNSMLEDANEISYKIIKEKFGFEFQIVIGYLVQLVNAVQIVEIMKKYKKLEELPLITKDNVKEAFLFYATEYLKIIEFYSIPLNSIGMNKIPLETQYIADYTYFKYGIKFTLLNRLLEFHGLYEDETIKFMADNIKVYEPNF